MLRDVRPSISQERNALGIKYMEFTGIEQLLSKYRRYFVDKDEEYKKICVIIEQVSHIHLVEHELAVFKGGLFITGNSVLKNELFLFKDKIIAELHKNGLTGINELR